MSDQQQANKNDAERVLESILPVGEHEEEGHDEEGRKVRHRGVYLLPNLFTTANLFAGFYSVVCAINGNFYVACAAILWRWYWTAWMGGWRA